MASRLLTLAEHLIHARALKALKCILFSVKISYKDNGYGSQIFMFYPYRVVCTEHKIRLEDHGLNEKKSCVTLSNDT